MKKLSLLFCIVSIQIFAQNNVVEMADGFRADGKIHVVIGVIAVILIGIFGYLYVLDKKLERLEK